MESDLWSWRCSYYLLVVVVCIYIWGKNQSLCKWPTSARNQHHTKRVSECFVYLSPSINQPRRTKRSSAVSTSRGFSGSSSCNFKSAASSINILKKKAAGAFSPPVLQGALALIFSWQPSQKLSNRLSLLAQKLVKSRSRRSASRSSPSTPVLHALVSMVL